MTRLRRIALAAMLAAGSLPLGACGLNAASDAAPTTVTVTVTESGTPNDCGVGIWPPPIETTCGARPPRTSCNPGDPGFPNCVG